MSEKLVKVKMLKNAGPYVIGQEVEVSEAQADSMCTLRKRETGYGLTDYRVAITIEEFEKIKSMPIDLGGLTIEEARELGIKNIVSPPTEQKAFQPGFQETRDSVDTSSAKNTDQVTTSKKRAS